jgi:hypothetical protein
MRTIEFLMRFAWLQQAVIGERGHFQNGFLSLALVDNLSEDYFIRRTFTYYPLLYIFTSSFPPFS